MADRLQADRSPSVLAACLDGLRLAGLLQRASIWAAILDEEGVAAAMRSVAVQLARSMPDSLDLFDSRVAAAVPRLASVNAPDRRLQRIRSVSEDSMTDVIDGTAEADEAVRLLNACARLADGAPTALAGLDRFADDADLARVAGCIAAAARVDPRLGQTFSTSAGGAERLVERSRLEIPWVTSVDLTTQDGAQRVRFSWLYLAPEGQDAHGAVVTLCRTFLDLFPEAVAVNGQAVGASGAPAGFADFTIAVKDIPRENLVSPEEVRWNRQSLRAFATMSALPPKTDRLVAEADLLHSALRLTTDAGAAWVRGDRTATDLMARLVEVAEACKQVPRAEALPDDPTEISHQSIDVGDAADVCQSLCGNALPRLLSEPNLGLASFLHTVRGKIQTIVGTQYWRLLADDHDAELTELERIVAGLHAVLCARLTNPGPPSSAMRRSTCRQGTPAVEAAARVARREAEEALGTFQEAIGRHLRALGLRGSMDSAPAAEPSGMAWPEADLLVVVDVPSTLDFLRVTEQVAAAVRGEIEPIRSAVIAPQCHGRILGDMVFSVRQASNGALFPAFGTFDAWAPSLRSPVLVSAPLGDIGAITNAGLVVGALGEVEGRRPLLEPERQAADDALALAAAAQDRLAAAATQDGSGFLTDALRPVIALVSGPDSARTIANLALGADPESAAQFAVIRAAVLEWELDLEGAPTRIAEIPSGLTSEADGS